MYYTDPFTETVYRYCAGLVAASIINEIKCCCPLRIEKARTHPRAMVELKSILLDSCCKYYADPAAPAAALR